MTSTPPRIAGTIQAAHMLDNIGGGIGRLRRPFALGAGGGVTGLETTTDGIPVQGAIVDMAVAVDAPVPLLHAVWVPRNLVVDELGTVILKVDAFAGEAEGFAHGREKSQFDVHGLSVL